MSTLKLLLLLIISLNTFAQVKVDHTIEKKYKLAFKKMSLLQQQNLIEFEKKEPFIGISIFTTNQVDTLNKQEMLSDGNDITIKDIEPNLGKSEANAMDENSYHPVFLKLILLMTHCNLQ